MYATLNDYVVVCIYSSASDCSSCFLAGSDNMLLAAASMQSVHCLKGGAECSLVFVPPSPMIQTWDCMAMGKTGVECMIGGFVIYKHEHTCQGGVDFFGWLIETPRAVISGITPPRWGRFRGTNPRLQAVARKHRALERM